MRRVEPFKLNIVTENVGMQNSEENQKEMERAMEIAKRDIISREQQKFRASFADFTNLIQIAQESNLRKEEIPFAITMAIAAQFAAFLLKYQTKEIEKIGLNVVKNMYQVVHKIGSIKKMTPNDYLSITLTDIPLLATSVIPSLTRTQIERMKNTINALIVPLLMKILEDNFETTKGKGQIRGGAKNDDSDNEEDVALEDASEDPLLKDDDDGENQPGLWDRVKNAFGTLGEYVFSLMPASASVPKTKEEMAKLTPEQKQALKEDYDFLEDKKEAIKQARAAEIDAYISKQRQEWQAMKKNPDVTRKQLRNFKRDYKKTLKELRLQQTDELIDEWKQREMGKKVPRWEPETQGTLRLQTPWQKFLVYNYLAAPFIQAISFPTIKRAEFVNQMPDDFKIADLSYLPNGDSFLAALDQDTEQLENFIGEQLTYHGLINSPSEFTQIGLRRYLETFGELKALTNKNDPEARQEALQTLVGRFVEDQTNLPQLTSENMVQAITTDTSSLPLFNKTEVKQRAGATKKTREEPTWTVKLGSYFRNPRKLFPFTSAENQTPAVQTTENQTAVKPPFKFPTLFGAYSKENREKTEEVMKMLEEYRKSRGKRYDQYLGNPDTINRLANPLNPKDKTDLDLAKSYAISQDMYQKACAIVEKIITDDGQISADYADQLRLDEIRKKLGINTTYTNLTQQIWDEQQTEQILQGAIIKIYASLGEGAEEGQLKNSHEVLKELEKVQQTLDYMQTNSTKSSKHVQEILDFANKLIAQIKPIANEKKIPPPGYWKTLYWGMLDLIDNSKSDNWFAKRLYNTFKEPILEKNTYDIQTATGLGTVTSRTIAGAVALLSTTGVSGLLLFNFGKRMLNYIWSFFKRKAVEKAVEVSGSEKVGKALGIVIENGERAIQESIDTMWERNRRYRAKTLEMSMKGAKTAAKLAVAATAATMGAPTALTSIGALTSLIQRNKGLAASIKNQPRSAVPAVNERRKLILRRLNEENKENQGKIREIQKTRKAIASKFRTALPDITSWFKPSHHSTKSSSGHSSSNSPSLASVAAATKKRLDEKARKEEREKEMKKKEQEKERKKTKKEAAALVDQLQKDYEKKLEKYEKELEQYQRSQPKGTKHLKTKPVKIAKTKKPRKMTTAKILPKKPRLTLTLQQTTKAKKPTKGKVRTHTLNMRSNKRARKI